MDQIVDAYVRLGNRRALFSLLPVGQIEEELAVIEKGLERLHTEGAGAAAGEDGSPFSPRYGTFWREICGAFERRVN